MATYDIRPLQLRILKNLLAIDKVCKEHNLRYYIMAGTMLGAVRHKGFIPRNGCRSHTKPYALRMTKNTRFRLPRYRMPTQH